MRRLDLSFTALLLPLDFLALMLAAISAYSLRFSRYFTELRPIITSIPFPDYLASAAMFTGIWMIFFALAGLYSLSPRRAWSMLGRVFLASTAGIMVIIASVFFTRALDTSRFVIAAVWGLAIFYVSAGRLLLRLIRRALLKARIGHRQIALIGSSEAALKIAEMYQEHPELGLTIAKIFKQWNEEARNELATLAQHGDIDTILLAEPELDRIAALDIITLAEEHNLDFRYLADLFSASFTNVEIDTVGGIPIIEVKRTPLDGWGRIFKRLFDLLTASLLLLLLSPIMLLTTIAIIIDSRGPIFYRLDDDTPPQRIGERGHPFRYFKFRSMFPRTHAMRYNELKHLDVREGPLVKIKNDPRITRVGTFIRKWSLDELPELFSVLMGKMSLVGPRPHLPEEVKQYKPHHRRVLAIKPGVTGMAQISGRSDLSFDEEVRLDSWYIEHWSPALDLYILLKTPGAVFRKRSVH